MSRKLPPTPAVDAATDLITACGQLVRRLRAESNTLELTWSQSIVLARLESGAMSTADLARAESVKPQSMGGTLSVMETEGLVERSPHPTDGRQSLFGLTAKGMDARRRTRTAKQSWLADAVAQLSPAEQADLVRAAEVITRLSDMSRRDPL